MNKIKIFKNYYSSKVENQVNDFIREGNHKLISSSIAVDDSDDSFYYVVVITYEENKEKEQEEK